MDGCTVVTEFPCTYIGRYIRIELHEENWKSTFLEDLFEKKANFEVYVQDTSSFLYKGDRWYVSSSFPVVVTCVAERVGDIENNDRRVRLAEEECMNDEFKGIYKQIQLSQEELNERERRSREHEERMAAAFYASDGYHPSQRGGDPDDIDIIKVGNPLDVQTGGDHYKKNKIQPVVYITENNLSYLQGNVIKYITRYKDKNGEEDLKKAKHYIDLILELEYGDDK